MYHVYMLYSVENHHMSPQDYLNIKAAEESRKLNRDHRGHNRLLRMIRKAVAHSQN